MRGQPRPAAGGAGQARTRRVGRHGARGLRADGGGVQPGRRVRQPAHRLGPALRRARRWRAAARREARRDTLRQVLPDAARSGLQPAGEDPRQPTSPPRCASSSTPGTARRWPAPAPPAPTTSCTPSGSPMWVPYDPARTTTSPALRERVIAAAGAYREDYAAYFERQRLRGRRDVRSRRARRADRERRPGRRGAHAQGGGHLARPLSPRDRGDGRRRTPCRRSCR